MNMKNALRLIILTIANLQGAAEYPHADIIGLSTSARGRHALIIQNNAEVPHACSIGLIYSENPVLMQQEDLLSTMAKSIAAGEDFDTICDEKKIAFWPQQTFRNDKDITQVRKRENSNDLVALCIQLSDSSVAYRCKWVQNRDRILSSGDKKECSLFTNRASCKGMTSPLGTLAFVVNGRSDVPLPGSAQARAESVQMRNAMNRDHPLSLIIDLETWLHMIGKQDAPSIDAECRPDTGSSGIGLGAILQDLVGLAEDCAKLQAALQKLKR